MNIKSEIKKNLIVMDGSMLTGLPIKSINIE